MKRLVLGIGAALLLLAAVALAWPRRAAAPAGPPPRLVVAATVFPLADWLRAVGGPEIQVHLLVNAQSDPHHFEPTIQDALALTQARALFAVGMELDPWARRLAANADTGADFRFFSVGDWIVPRRFSSQRNIAIGAGDADADEHAHGAEDPHFWFDPARVQVVVRRMAEELEKLDPPRAAVYADRARTYETQLDELEVRIAQAARDIRPGAKIVTFHDAYGYLLDRLGVTVAAVVQVSPGVEPGPRDVTEAVRAMREIGQRTVFAEPAGSRRAADIVAAEVGGSVTPLDPLDTEISPVGRTYLERMNYDLDTLEKALR